MDCSEVYKIVLVGNTGVGKSSLLTRLCEAAYTDSHISTIGVDFVRTRTHAEFI